MDIGKPRTPSSSLACTGPGVFYLPTLRKNSCMKTEGLQSNKTIDEVLKEFRTKQMAAIQGQAKGPNGRSFFQNSNQEVKRSIGRLVLVPEGGPLKGRG